MTSVFIISAPSGSGKSTLVGNLLQQDPGIRFSISYTSRKPRGKEVSGREYYFVSREEFEARLERDEFLEWAQVFGNYYGTHLSELEAARAAGKDLLLDIDIQGARQLKSKIRDAVTIFVLAPSRQILEHRLRSRSEDSDEVIRRRLEEAAAEIRSWREYDYVLVNQDVTESVGTLRAIVQAERVRRTRMEDKVLPILKTFNQSEEQE